MWGSRGILKNKRKWKKTDQNTVHREKTDPQVQQVYPTTKQLIEKFEQQKTDEEPKG